MNSGNIVDILNLPLVLQRELFGSWLTIREVAKMDSAICSREARLIFLELLTMECLVLNNPRGNIAHHNLMSWMAWVVMRKVNITTSHLFRLVSPELFMPFFAHIGKQLETLTIRSHCENDIVFSQMLSCIASYCVNITELSLTWCSTLQGLENILRSSKESITKLYLDNCNLSELQNDDLQLLSLQFLSIFSCRNVMLPQLLRAAPNLEILSCYGLNSWPSDVLCLYTLCAIDITDAAFCSLVHSCPLLEAIQLSDCSLLTDVSVLELVQHAKHLSALSLSENTSFTDAALEAIAVQCGERLKHFCLGNCCPITDAGLKHISEACHRLEGFGFGIMDTNHVTTTAIQALLHSNPLLQEVSLWNIEDGDVLLTTLAKCCPELRYFDLSLLNGFTEVGVMAVMSACSRLRTVVVDPDCTVLSPLAQCLCQKYYCSELQFLFNQSGFLPFWFQYRSPESRC